MDALRDTHCLEKAAYESEEGVLQSPRGEHVSVSANPDILGRPPNEEDSQSCAASSKQWLTSQLKALEIEFTSVFQDGHGVWHVRNKKRLVGRIRESEIGDENAVKRLTDLYSGLTIRIRPDEAQWSLLWALSRSIPHVKRVVMLGLLRKENDSTVPVRTWAYRKAVEAYEGWQKSQRNRVFTDPKDKNKRLLDAEWSIATPILATAADETANKFDAWRNNDFHKAAPPWAKSFSFRVKAGGVRIQQVGRVATKKAGKITLGSKRVYVTLTLLGRKNGRNQEQPTFHLTPESGSAWATVNRLLSGEEKARGCSIVQDGKKWLIKLTCSRPRPDKAKGDRVMLMRRSMKEFACLMTTDGDTPLYPPSGENLIAIKSQMQDRRRKIRRDLVHGGDGARGHGKTRAYRRYTAFGDIERRYVDSWCKQMASAVIQQCTKMQCSTLIVEDFGESVPEHTDTRYEKVLRRFPFCALFDSIAWAGTKVGVTVKKQLSDPDQKCPVCGEILGTELTHWRVCSCGLAVEDDVYRMLSMAVAAGLPWNMQKIEDQTKLFEHITNEKSGKELARRANAKRNHPAPQKTEG